MAIGYKGWRTTRWRERAYKIDKTLFNVNWPGTPHEGDEDVGNFIVMIWRSGGTAAVVDMRMDADLVAALVDMGRSKGVYGSRVSGLLALSDTVTTELERSSERAR